MSELKQSHVVHASIARRGLAFFIDLILCSLLAAGIGAGTQSIGINSPLPSWIYFTLFACYFIVLSSHRFNATLGMRISGLHVIRCNGKNQFVWQAVLHTISKFATFYAVISIAPASVKNEDLLIASLGVILLLIPVFHPKKHALHNILLGTQVIYGDMPIVSNEQHIIIEDQQYWAIASIFKTLGEALFILFFIGVLHIGFSATHNRDLIARTIYALNKTHDLKIQIEEFYLYHKHYAENKTELSEFSQIAFPDGGGARVEKDGVIRIWFDVLPELKNGNIWLTPNKPNDDQIMEWNCTSKNIKKNWLPSTCRN